MRATAPVIGGDLVWSRKTARLRLTVAIDRVRTGNAMLDVETRALVRRGSAEVLTFVGAGPVRTSTITIVGEASAGRITVPLVLTGRASFESEPGASLELSGTASFENVRIPMRGVRGTHRLDVRVTGDLSLVRP